MAKRSYVKVKGHGSNKPGAGGNIGIDLAAKSPPVNGAGRCMGFRTE